MSNSLISTAQQRGFLNKIHEGLNLNRKFTEKFVGQYGEAMNLLREVDDSIREEANGMRSCIKAADKAFAEGRLLDVAHWCGVFNDSMKNIVKETSRIVSLQEDQLHEFYGDAEHADLDKDYFDAQAELDRYELMKEAGVFDFLNPRHRARKHIEKMYKLQVAERNRAIKSLLGRMKSTLSITLSSLKQLASFRASGDLSSYIQKISVFFKVQSEFQKEFKSVYTKHFSKIIEWKKKNAPTETAEQELVGTPGQSIGYPPPEQKEKVTPADVERIPSFEEWQKQIAGRTDQPESEYVAPPPPSNNDVENTPFSPAESAPGEQEKAQSTLPFGSQVVDPYVETSRQTMPSVHDIDPNTLKQGPGSLLSQTVSQESQAPTNREVEVRTEEQIPDTKKSEPSPQNVEVNAKSARSFLRDFDSYENSFRKSLLKRNIARTPASAAEQVFSNLTQLYGALSAAQQVGIIPDKEFKIREKKYKDLAQRYELNKGNFKQDITPEQSREAVNKQFSDAIIALSKIYNKAQIIKFALDFSENIEIVSPEASSDIIIAIEKAL